MGYTRKYNLAFQNLLGFEKGYTVDTGGPTNNGITLRSLRSTNDPDFDIDHDGDIDHNDLINMTIEKDKLYYFKYWWNRYNLGSIDSFELSSKILEIIVNIGPRPGFKILQQAHNAISFRKLKVDGIFGPITLSYVNMADTGRLLNSVRQFQKRYYHQIVDANPKKYGKYLKGWLRRADS